MGLQQAEPLMSISSVLPVRVQTILERVNRRCIHDILWKFVRNTDRVVMSAQRWRAHFYLERIKMQISDQNSSQFSGCKLQGPDSRGSRGASLPKGPSLPHPQSQAPRSRFQIPDIFDAPTPLQSRLTVSTDTTLLIVFQQDCARTRYILSAVQLVHAFE